MEITHSFVLYLTHSCTLIIVVLSLAIAQDAVIPYLAVIAWQATSDVNGIHIVLKRERAASNVVDLIDWLIDGKREGKETRRDHEPLQVKVVPEGTSIEMNETRD